MDEGGDLRMAHGYDSFVQREAVTADTKSYKAAR